jgi:hypothetical protein
MPPPITIAAPVAFAAHFSAVRMHNHYHVLLFIDKSTANKWAALEVVERWHLLFSGTLYSQRFANYRLNSPIT